MKTAVVLMDPGFFTIIFTHTIYKCTVLFKVEVTHYEICSVSKHDYLCAAVEPLFPLLTFPCTKMLPVYRKYVVCQNMITAVPVLL